MPESRARRPRSSHYAGPVSTVALLSFEDAIDRFEPVIGLETVAGWFAAAMREREAQIPRDVKFPLTQAVQWVVELYDASGQPDKAKQWRARLTEPAIGKE